MSQIVGSRIKGVLGRGIALTARFSPEAAAQAARPTLVVDAHVHMWKASTPERPWIPGAAAQLPQPFTIERLVPVMDEAGVDRVVIVAPSLEGDRLDYAQEAPGKGLINCLTAVQSFKSSRFKVAKTTDVRCSNTARAVLKSFAGRLPISWSNAVTRAGGGYRRSGI